ncbi:MAG: hypothetical protein U0P30_16670 [Vicinamibacterales bacterium]
MRTMWLVLAASLVATAALPSSAFAQGDEIQVYDGGLADPGVFNLTWHNNFTPRGVKDPAFPGAVTADKSFNGVTEWAYGVTDWFEAGLYLPLYTRDVHDGFGIDGGKLRTLFAVPHGGDRKFAYGLGLEFSYNAKRWDSTRVTSEIRPILAWHLNPKFDVIVNPILDTAYDNVGNLDFAPSTRVAYNKSTRWSYALETYSDFGQLRGFLPAASQSHQLYAVIDHVAHNGVEMEFGAGLGLTDAADRFTVKLILARDLNKR